MTLYRERVLALASAKPSLTVVTDILELLLREKERDPHSGCGSPVRRIID
jgi:hypothetical protein